MKAEVEHRSDVGSGQSGYCAEGEEFVWLAGWGTFCEECFTGIAIALTVEDCVIEMADNVSAQR